MTEQRGGYSAVPEGNQEQECSSSYHKCGERVMYMYYNVRNSKRSYVINIVYVYAY